MRQSSPIPPAHSPLSLEPSGATGNGSRIQERGADAFFTILRILCWAAAYLLIEEVLSLVFGWKRLTNGLLHFIPYCLLLVVVVYYGRSLDLWDKQTLLMVVFLGAGWVVFFLDVTRDLPFLKGVSLIGSDSWARRQISSLAILVAVAAFPASSYYMLEDLYRAKAQLDQKVCKLQAAEIELRRLYEQTRQDAETKANLLREINHRVKNNLISMKGLLVAQKCRSDSPSNSPPMMTVLDDLSMQVGGMIEVHDMLSETHWAPMCLADLVKRIITGVTDVLGSGKQIMITVNPSTIAISPRQATSLALAINEMATNTLKYAAARRSQTAIQVRIEGEGDRICLDYRDDGPGFPEEVLAGQRRGVGLVLLQQLSSGSFRGTCQFSNDSGARIVLHLKADELNRT